MKSFLHYGPGLRPVVVGAVTCGALLLPAAAAQAYHPMADGTMCPHAAGTLAPGEAPAAPGVQRAASSAPIGSAASSPAPAARPAAKPASKAPSQRPATQAQTQQPAASQAQVQRPAAATQAVASKVQAPATSQRQVPVAKRAVAPQPRAGAAKPSAAKRQASRPAAKPVVADVPVTVRPSVPAERPAVYSTAAASPAAESGFPVPAAIVVGLLGLFGIAAAAVVAMRRRVVGAKSATPAPTFVESKDAAIEAELQEIIAETKLRALSAPAVEDEELELSETR